MNLLLVLTSAFAAAATALQSYEVIGTNGKCTNSDGEDPEYKYHHGKGDQCESLCSANEECYGYSVSSHDNCIVWLERELYAGGNSWGGADCTVKKLEPKPPVPQGYETIGLDGKCLSSAGKDPKHKYYGSKGDECSSLCDEDAECHGYSVSSFGNCLLWLESGLKAGGASWGGAGCMVKKSKPQPDSKYEVIDENGKCTNAAGEDPKYKYHSGMGSECEALCDEREDCHGYSVSSFDNCLLWLEPGLMAGGENWGDAKCIVKKSKPYEWEVIDENGKCLNAAGGDPKHKYYNGMGSECESLCDEREDCYGYSVSSFGNCLLWLEPGLTAGGANWGDAKCTIKKSKPYEYKVSDEPGKCTNALGEDPKYKYHSGLGSECESLCDQRWDCHGYSVSSFDNCLLWLEPGLIAGGANWGGATCIIKVPKAEVTPPSEVQFSKQRGCCGGRSLKVKKTKKRCGVKCCEEMCKNSEECTGFQIRTSRNKRGVKKEQCDIYTAKLKATKVDTKCKANKKKKNKKAICAIKM